MMLSSCLALLFAALTTHMLILVLMPTLRARLLDHPNFRSSHLHPTPSGGGIAFVFVSSIASGFALILFSLTSNTGFPTAHIPYVALPLFCLPLALLGLIDDRNSLSPLFRFFVQLAVSLPVILSSPLALPWLFLPVALIVVTAVINFTNFMDGLDGLVASCMAISIATAAIYNNAPLSGWVIVGALIGFLLWNWCPAKVFMGDAGSTFLGLYFAGVVLQALSWVDAFGLFLVPIALFADAFFCVVRRIFAGQRVFSPHRLHLFQRLHQAGWSHAHVSTLYTVATLVMSTCFLFSGLTLLLLAASAVLLIGFVLDHNYAVSFALASHVSLDDSCTESP